MAEPVCAGEEPPATGAVGANPSYVVFAGLDVFVEEQGQRRPVVGGSETEVLVWDERRNESVALHQVALSGAVEPRVTRARVTIDGLKGYPVFSPANDPAAAAHDQQAFLLNLEGARAEESEVRARTAQAVADSFSGVAPSVNPNSPGAAQFQAQMNEAMNDASTTMSDMASTYANPVYRDSRVGSPLDENAYDGFAVAFSVSAPQPVDDVYGVLRLRVRASNQPGAQPVHALKLFRVRSLQAKPRKVVVRQYGLPPGYTLESYEVHLYANGYELAANTSQNRFEVTEDEAHQFMILRHAQSHPGATMPAEVARELRRDLPEAFALGASGNMLVNFTIAADGTVVGLDTGALPPEGGPALRAVRFLPALVNGKPVESEGTFALGELFLPGGEEKSVR